MGAFNNITVTSINADLSGNEKNIKNGFTES